MTLEEIKELVKSSQELAYLEGFIKGYEADKKGLPCFPFNLKSMKEVTNLHEVMKIRQQQEIVKFLKNSNERSKS